MGWNGIGWDGMVLCEYEVCKVNHLLFMDGLSVIGNSESKIKSLIRILEVTSKDVGTEVGMKKSG